MWRRRRQPPNEDAAARELDYLLGEEKEERGERRGLEQRAAGLLAALLIAFPVAAAVAKDADTGDGVQLAGLLLLMVILIIALAQAQRLTSALGAPKRRRNVIRRARKEVGRALAAGDLVAAARAERTIVATMRRDNGRLVRRVRRVTVSLPATLLGLLLALVLLIAAGGADDAKPRAQCGHGHEHVHTSPQPPASGVSRPPAGCKDALNDRG